MGGYSLRKDGCDLESLSLQLDYRKLIMKKEKEVFIVERGDRAFPVAIVASSPEEAVDIYATRFWAGHKNEHSTALVRGVRYYIDWS